MIVHVQDLPSRDAQWEGVELGLAICGAAVAVTNLSNDVVVVEFYWRPELARQCRPIALAFLKAYAGEDPQVVAGADREGLAFRVPGEEEQALACSQSFMHAVFALEAA